MNSDAIELTLENGMEVSLSIEQPPSIIFSPNNTMAMTAAVGTIITDMNNYESLDNLPSIEDVTLIGNITLPEIGVDILSNMEIERLLALA